MHPSYPSFDILPLGKSGDGAYDFVRLEPLVSDYSRRNSHSNDSSSSSSSSSDSSLEWENSFGGSGALESHIMAGGRLEFGDRGEEVRDLQELLGFNRPDGVFGPMTMRQLTLAQGALGMTESGVVDLATYAQLSDFMRSGQDIRAILFGQVGTGASSDTGRQDGLGPGQKTSVKMAQSDEDRVLVYKDKFIQAAERYALPPSLLAAIASRETRGGSQLNESGYSVYGGNEGFGLMQVDGGHHSPAGAPFSLEHVEQAAGILAGFRDQLRRRHTEWSDAQVLKGAVAAYNCGPGRIRTVSGMDSRTTGKDYSNDTWVRAQYYARFFPGGAPLS